MWIVYVVGFALILMGLHGSVKADQRRARTARPANSAADYLDSAGRAPGWNPTATRTGYYAVTNGIAEITDPSRGEYYHSTGHIQLVDGSTIHGDWDADGTNSTPGNSDYDLGRYLGPYGNTGPARVYKQQLGIQP